METIIDYTTRCGARNNIIDYDSQLKGTATLINCMFYQKELCKPWILIPVSSKSVEKCGSCVRLNICKWTVMEAAIL